MPLITTGDYRLPAPDTANGFPRAFALAPQSGKRWSGTQDSIPSHAANERRSSLGRGSACEYWLTRHLVRPRDDGLLDAEAVEDLCGTLVIFRRSAFFAPVTAKASLLFGEIEGRPGREADR